MKVLVIGANGQLGSYLLNALKKEHEVTPLYHNLDNQEKVNIEDYGKIKEIIEKYSPDAVINTSAFHQVDVCETKEGREKAFLINADAVKNLAEICKERNIILVHISTDYVFDGKKREHYTEDDFPNPISNYGKSKLEGESYIRKIPKHFLIRTSSLYGKKGSGQKGSNIILTLINASQKGEVKAVHDNRITPSYAKDVAEKISELIKTDKYGLYHLSNSGECSIYELTEEICKLEGLSPKMVKINFLETNSIPGKAQRPQYSQLNSINLKKAGLSAMRAWQEALGDYLKEGRKENGV